MTCADTYPHHPHFTDDGECAGVRGESVREASERLGLPQTKGRIPPEIVHPAPFEDDSQPDTASRELREAARAVCDGADQDETYCFGCHNERPCEHDALRAALANEEK